MTPKAEALRDVIDGTRALFHVLANAAEELHADLGLLASHRAVLESVVREGAATVPAIARRKGVSRQHIQSVVNALVETGLVSLEENPSHRRSSIVTLTRAGETLFAKAQKRERDVLGQAASSMRWSDLVTTKAVLDQIAEVFASADKPSNHTRTPTTTRRN